MKCCVFVLMLVIASGASAQVNKCVDTKGKTVYSEQPCAADQRGGQLLGRQATEKNAEMDAYSAQSHRESLSRTLRQQRDAIDGPPRAREAEREYESDQEPVAEAERSTAANSNPTSCDTWTPRKGCIGGSRATNPTWSPRKGYTGGSSAEDRQRDERDRLAAEQAARKAQPTSMTNCNAGGCWDNAGNRYNRTGDGSRFVRSDGKFCTTNGNFVNCN